MVKHLSALYRWVIPLPIHRRAFLYNQPTVTILAAFSTLVDEMRAHNSAIKILTAQIRPMNSARLCSSCAQCVINFNNDLFFYPSSSLESGSEAVLRSIRWITERQ